MWSETYMMYDVIMSNVMKEKTTLPSQKVSINCSGGAPLKVPFFATVMRQDGIRMMQISYHDDYTEELAEAESSHESCAYTNA